MVGEERECGLVLKPGEGKAVWFLGNLTVVKATAETTNGAYGLVESLVPAGASPPMHVHHREDESFWVLEGALKIFCGEETYDAPAGSYIFLPRDVPHTFKVVSETPVRLLTLMTPGGGEQFFVEAGRPAERMTLPPAGPPDLAKLEEVAIRFGSEFYKPGQTPSAS
jgi:quercetin dioxygenase-like cupin family protein